MALPNEQLRQIDIVKIYSGKKCLVIDDFPEIRGSLTRMLKTFGAESVETAANGEEAIPLCQKKRYDIVLCDYNLGAGKDGQQILEEVRYLRVVLMTSLFVMITGESSREMVLGALECQPDDYITKPFTQASLKSRLDKAILRHEALLHIKTEISKTNYEKALSLCNEMIVGGSRYAPECLKMKGQLHVLIGQVKEAQKVYASIIAKKPVVWARIGLCRALIEGGELDKAEQHLNDIIKEDARFIEAHDMLAEIHTQRDNAFQAQKATENASHISPKSVLRHRRLADLAELNSDDSTALKAYQQTIKWGVNSCYESPQDYFNFARKAAQIAAHDNSPAGKANLKQASTYIERAKKRYSNRPEITAQSHMVSSQLLQSEGKQKAAEQTLEKAKALYEDIPVPSLDASLELARTLQALEHHDEASTHLKQLAARNNQDPDILKKIDSIAVEPISDLGKASAAMLTKTGITAYEAADYLKAIGVFKEALHAYPKHTGLNLNLMQAICAHAEKNGISEEYEKLCIRSMRSVGQLSDQDPQYKRLKFISGQVNKFYPIAMRGLKQD